MPPPVMPTLAPRPMPAPDETRDDHFVSATMATPVYARDKFGAGNRFAGPAIIVQLDATTVVPPGWNAEIHSSGAMILTRN